MEMEMQGSPEATWTTAASAKFPKVTAVNLSWHVQNNECLLGLRDYLTDMMIVIWLMISANDPFCITIVIFSDANY